MLNADSFLIDSLFCEYAYIINTDNNTLEYYLGFNERPRAGKGRYATKTSSDDSSSNSKYYGVMLAAKLPLESIIGADDDKIKNFIKKMEKKSERE